MQGADHSCVSTRGGLGFPAPQGLYDPRFEHDAAAWASSPTSTAGVARHRRARHRGPDEPAAPRCHGRRTRTPATAPGILIQIPDRSSSECERSRDRAPRRRPLRGRHVSSCRAAPNSGGLPGGGGEDGGGGGPARSSAGERCRPTRARSGESARRDAAGGSAVLRRRRG